MVIWGIAGDSWWGTRPPERVGRLAGLPAWAAWAKGSGVGPPRCLRVQIPRQKTCWSLGSGLARDTPARVFAAGVYSPVTPGVGGFRARARDNCGIIAGPPASRQPAEAAPAVRRGGPGSKPRPTAPAAPRCRHVRFRGP